MSKDSAIAAWNRRAAPPVPQDVARLIADIRAHAKRIDGTAEHAISAAFLIDGADALAALAGENARLREALTKAEAECDRLLDVAALGDPSIEMDRR